nr:MAG TPA: hypothetical protein [Caudoviricetes sp.]
MKKNKKAGIHYTISFILRLLASYRGFINVRDKLFN